MNLKVKILGFPDIQEILGGNEISLEINGKNLGDLLEHLQGSYGPVMQKALQGQILRNGREWLQPDDLCHPLEDGDQVSFFHLVAGG